MEALFINRGFLREGHIIDLGPDGHCEVVLVNDCRAACVPVARREVEIKPLATGKPVTFLAIKSGINISPCSEFGVLARSKEEYERRGGQFDRGRSRDKHGDSNRSAKPEAKDTKVATPGVGERVRAKGRKKAPQRRVKVPRP